jgi:hypothetical protein
MQCCCCGACWFDINIAVAVQAAVRALHPGLVVGVAIHTRLIRMLPERSVKLLVGLSCVDKQAGVNYNIIGTIPFGLSVVADI